MNLEKARLPRVPATCCGERGSLAAAVLCCLVAEGSVVSVFLQLNSAQLSQPLFQSNLCADLVAQLIRKL